jgi:hypothetical protein
VTGPREWSPKVEPAEGDFKFAGLKIHVKRIDRPLVELDMDRYDISVTSPDDVTYRYRDVLPTMDKYKGTGLLGAAMAALLDIESVKRDPHGYLVVLEEVDGMDPAKAKRILVMAQYNAQSFDLKNVEKALDQISEEMNKNPSVQRGAKRGWDKLMEDRGQQPF